MDHSSESNPPISFWPFLLAIGLLMLVAGVVVSLIVTLVGVLCILAALVGWVQETRLFGVGESDTEPEDEATHE